MGDSDPGYRKTPGQTGRPSGGANDCASPLGTLQAPLLKAPRTKLALSGWRQGHCQGGGRIAGVGQGLSPRGMALPFKAPEG